MMQQPVIYSVNGPVVKIRNTNVFSMMEMVYVGNRRLIGEVIGLTDTETTIQVYESTSGLQTGEPVEPTGAPMSVTLGPGILTNIFDGIERPLRALEEASGAFIGDGQQRRTQPTHFLFQKACRAVDAGGLEGV